MKKYLFLSALAVIAPLVIAKTPEVITTIKPLHSLVAQIMDGVATPKLLIKEGSPHSYQIKPSDIKAMNKADLLIWVSDDLEIFMPKTTEKLDNKVNTMVWAELPNIHLLKNRKGGMWQEAESDDEHVNHGFGHATTHTDAAHHHHHGEYNPHLWLGINNAEILVKAVTKKLSELDQENAAIYQANTNKTLSNLNQLRTKIAHELLAVAAKPYMTFHDAYPYFEAEFDLHPIGVVRVDPEHEAGAKRITEIRKIFTNNKIICIFNEPQFPSKLTDKLIEGTNVRTGILDPIGATLPVGAELYEKLLLTLASSLKHCLSQ